MAKNTEIKLFQDRQVRSVWDEEQEKWYFSIVDVVSVLTDSADPKQYIKKMRTRDPELNSRWGTICTPTKMRATDGKLYSTQAATAEGIFRLIQSIPSPKAEPFKQWMAQVAAQRLDQMADPQTLAENMQCAADGGNVAKVAREELEAKTGRSVVSPLSAKRFFEEQKAQEIDNKEEK